MLLLFNSLIFIILILSFFFHKKQRNRYFVGATIILFYFIYIHLAPSVIYFNQHEVDKYLIISIQLKYFIFFAFPVILFSNPKNKFLPKFKKVKLNRFSSLLLLLFILSFYFIAISNGVFYRRLGIGIVEKIQTLSFFNKLLYQLYFYSYIPIIIFLLYVSKNGIKGLDIPSKIFVFLSILYAFVNSRIEVLIILIAILSLRYNEKVFSINKRNISFLVVSILSILLITSFRNGFFINDGKIDYDITLIDKGNNENSILKRADGIDYELKIRRSNFSPPQSTDYLTHQFKMLPLVGNDSYINERRKEGTTSGKIYLLNKTLGYTLTDTYSCILSDISIGVGYLGILCISILFTFLIRICYYLKASKYITSQIIFISIFSSIIFFELDLISILKRMIISMIILITFFNKYFINYEQ